ncbi:hypothetical protein ZWY2020_017011 [Hordeum vulgare]|nr:hypothetical protein ZWY2020_017011 [Hordeum vulgare]
MWHYTGPENSTRSHPEEVDEDTVVKWISGIAGPCDNPMGAKRVLPFSAQNSPSNKAWTNLHSPVPNGNALDIEEGSMEDSVESEEYVKDSEETEEEEEEESEEEDSSPSRHEPRSKLRHDPAGTPSKPLASSGRSAKRVRVSSSKPVEQPAKVSKPSGSKPRKALPRMRIVVPVASWLPSGTTSIQYFL